MANFPGGPGLAGARMYPLWILVELRMMGDGSYNCSNKTAKLQSNCHHQHRNTQLFTGRMPFLTPNQQCQSTEGGTSQPDGTGKWP